MKTLQELTLFDRFLFNETMEIPEAHEAVLRIILGDEKLKLLSQVQTEKRDADSTVASFPSVWTLFQWIRTRRSTIRNLRSVAIQI